MVTVKRCFSSKIKFILLILNTHLIANEWDHFLYILNVQDGSIYKLNSLV